jgi:hypothetical protein
MYCAAAWLQCNCVTQHPDWTRICRGRVGEREISQRVRDRETDRQKDTETETETETERERQRDRENNLFLPHSLNLTKLKQLPRLAHWWYLPLTTPHTATAAREGNTGLLVLVHAMLVLWSQPCMRDPGPSG